LFVFLFYSFTVGSFFFWNVFLTACCLRMYSVISAAAKSIIHLLLIWSKCGFCRKQGIFHCRYFIANITLPDMSEPDMSDLSLDYLKENPAAQY
jgi:hypothetical protein